MTKTVSWWFKNLKIFALLLVLKVLLACLNCVTVSVSSWVYSSQIQLRDLLCSPQEIPYIWGQDLRYFFTMIWLQSVKHLCATDIDHESRHPYNCPRCRYDKNSKNMFIFGKYGFVFFFFWKWVFPKWSITFVNLLLEIVRMWIGFSNPGPWNWKLLTVPLYVYIYIYTKRIHEWSWPIGKKLYYGIYHKVSFLIKNVVCREYKTAKIVFTELSKNIVCN